MKLSNKILLGLIGAILLYTLLSLGELRLRGKYINSNDLDLLAESKQTGNYKFLVIDSLESISIYNATEPRIEIRSISGDVLENLKITSSNDTLRIKSFQTDEKKQTYINLYVPDNLIYIRSLEGEIELKGINQKELTIIQSGGSTRFQDKVNIKKLSLVGSNDTKFHLNNSVVEELEVQMVDSQVAIRTKVSVIKGTIKDHSKLVTNGFNSISLEKDDSSSIYITR